MLGKASSRRCRSKRISSIGQLGEDGMNKPSESLRCSRSAWASARSSSRIYVLPWLATSFLAWTLSIMFAAQSLAQIATPSAQSLCDMPNMRGTAEYNKYCSPSPAQTGGGISPQQQMLLNGASDAGYALGSAFAQWLFSPDADAEQQQREAYMQELQRQREDAERNQRVEEARRLQAMYDRLVTTMKLHGLPDLHYKLASADNQMRFKLGDQSAQGYGIAGLPGMYTGGPRDGGSSQANQGAQAPDQSGNGDLNFKLGDSDAATSNSGTASNTSGYGIPGLPGIYTNGARGSSSATASNTNPQPTTAPDFSKMTPEQAAQMAKAASAFPAEQQERLVEAAQGSNPTKGLQTGKTQERPNANSASVPTSQSPVGPRRSSSQTQLASIQGSSQAAAAALTPEDASATARTGFDTPSGSTPDRGKLANGPLNPTSAAHTQINSASTPAPPQRISALTVQSPSANPLAASANGNLTQPSKVIAPASVGDGTCPQPSDNAVIQREVVGIQKALKELNKSMNLDAAQREEWEQDSAHASRDAWILAGSTTLDLIGDHIDAQIQDADAELKLKPTNREQLGNALKTLDRKDKLEKLHSAVEAAQKSYENSDLLVHADEQSDNKIELLEGIWSKYEATGASPLWAHWLKTDLDAGYLVAVQAASVLRLADLNRNSKQYLAAVKVLRTRMEVLVNTARAHAQTAASCAPQVSQK